ncbi:MAG: CaiB/BaiF CoA-transferase family protein [Gammaproteobacteria bacterium]|nr:CaiB/BaiF CoA-transferase family protein [Gammaproteobacteria bacterium]
MSYPLEGLKVLDFSRVLAGPFAGRMLCDLGADVVKIEPPDGDVTRYWGREIANIPGYFHQQNAGKRNICVDMRADGAVDLVNQLVTNADILIENFRPDVMPRLGIGYENLKEINPRLLMLSITGFGHNGPESRRATYAPVIHAEAGLIYRATQRNQIPYNDLPVSIADTNASLHGLVGLLSAMIMREKTGLGQHIDIAMIDSTVATDDQMHYDLEDSNDTGPTPNEVWETPFGPVLISTDFRVLYRELTTTLGFEGPSTPDMELPEKIRVRREAVKTFINSFLTRDKFEDAMKKINVAWGEVRDPATMAEQTTIQARGAIIEIDDRNGGTRPITQSPYRFSDAESGVRGPAAHRGEHNHEVMSEWLDKSSADTEELLAAGILVFDPEWKHH